jgi:hypothetical protein
MDKAQKIAKLKEARELISQEGAWTQGYSARDANGDVANCLSEEATCFCMIGAIARVDPVGWPTLRGALYRGDEALMEHGIAAWNDMSGRTQEEVVAMFDRAIEIAEAS